MTRIPQIPNAPALIPLAITWTMTVPSRTGALDVRVSLTPDLTIEVADRLGVRALLVRECDGRFAWLFRGPLCDIAAEMVVQRAREACAAIYQMGGGLWLSPRERRTTCAA